MNKPSLRLYASLARWSPLKSYQGKVLLVAIGGIHVPLLGVLGYSVVAMPLNLVATLEYVGVTLVATLMGTTLTLYALQRLLVPIRLTSLGLRAYWSKHSLPNLPTEYTDEVGVLMSDTQHTVHKLDEAIQYIASYDRLTTLPNRALFYDQLRQALEHAQRAGQQMAVLRLDIDGFKDVNSALGHSCGDALLKTMAQRLRSAVRETDVIARLGDDEFALLHMDVVTLDVLSLQAERLLATLAQPFRLDNETVYTSVCIGITVYPADGHTAEQLLENTDVAMHLAKQQGRSSYQFYSAELNAKRQRKLTLETELRDALVQRELVLHYQPQIDLQHGRIVGVEALVRWQHPVRGLISPNEFIPIAEASGLIVPIGEWVLRTACIQQRLWQSVGLPPLVIAVNLSARQIKQPNLVNLVANILQETGLDPTLLELEVTESMVMENLQQTTHVLEQLRRMGVAIALDDFGTGYSSLNYLKSFPINTLKIDRSFVRDVAVDANNAAIAQAIITLAHNLHLQVLAEGVEQDEQLRFLKRQGCDRLQGFLFSRPLPAEVLVNYLVRNAGSVAVVAA